MKIDKKSFKTNKLRQTLESRMKKLTTIKGSIEPVIPYTAKIEVNNKQEAMDDLKFRMCCEKLYDSNVWELGIKSWDSLDYTIPYKIQIARGIGFDNIYMTTNHLGNVDKFINCGLTSLSVKCDKDDLLKFKTLRMLADKYPNCEFSVFVKEEKEVEEVSNYIKSLDASKNDIKVYYKPKLIVDDCWKLYNCIHLTVNGDIVPSFAPNWKSKIMGHISSNKIIDVWHSVPFVQLRHKYKKSK